MWKVFSEPFMNADKIFPTQQRDVAKIVADISNNVNVKRVIVFGSSVTSACNPWSDIDLYFELGEDSTIPTFRGVDAALDKWSNYMVDDDLMAEILEKGVVVFDRDFTG